MSAVFLMENYKIYIFGIVALALALSVLSFHLLSDTKKKRIAEIKFLTGTYIFVFFFMIVFMLLIMIEFHRGPQIVLNNAENYQVIVKERVDVLKVEDVDTEAGNYLDPQHCFFLSLPLSPDWREPLVRNGLRSYLEKAGLETGKKNVESFVKWNPYRGALTCVLNDISLKPYDEMMLCLTQMLMKSSYGQMLQFSTSTVFEFGDTIEVKINPEFKTPLTGTLLSKDTKVLDSLNAQLESDSLDTPNFVELTFINYLNITVLDKSQIPLSGEKITLANYFLRNAINVSANAQKIISNEKMMLFTSSFDFEKAQFEDESRDFRVHRWVRMIEEPTKLYVIEMAYCPETDVEGVIWQDQKRMFESFGILTE